MIQIPTRNPTLRWAVILCGVSIFLWMSPEDNHIWPVVVLGTSASTLAVSWWVTGRFGGMHFNYASMLILSSTFGIIAGMGSAIITALLMFLKNARHSHFFPDFPLEQITAMLERAPVWAIAGGLIGLGLALIRITLQANTTPPPLDTNHR